ncbi:MAG: radical SAM protein [Pseudomonadota bacterium]
MIKVLLVQLPIPRLNFCLKTGNIPLGAACLKQAAAGISNVCVDIVPENLSSHAGDNALIRHITEQRPEILGFTVFSWNLERSQYIAEQIKLKIPVKVIFGGPEITPDNMPAHSDAVDFYAFGEGEAIFINLLKSDAFWQEGKTSSLSDKCFLTLGSPYVNGYLAPGFENLMLLETQRGCPYRCGFCYYNKSRKFRSIADDKTVLDGIAWAIENKVEEIYLLDPSLNSRPDLLDLLRKIKDLNHSEKIPLISEIRAESIDKPLADLFRKAGFSGFEVGLQTTNPFALKLMNRPTDLKTFLSGVKQLQAVGIAPTVDLIFGLPGDTLADFEKTLEFVHQNKLFDHIQVFPLLVLPGTDFKKKSRQLGLTYEPKPPYTLISTPTFTPNDMLLALDSAEDLFDITLCPFPDLEVSFKTVTGQDLYVTLEGTPCLSKLILTTPRPIREIQSLAEQITSSFQVFFGPATTDRAYQETVMDCISRKNPFVPMEIVFMEPGNTPDTNAILSAMATRRPHFLDQDLRYLYPEPGNRAIQFTMITKNPDRFFEGEMKRQVYLWDRAELPEEQDFKTLSHLDGLLIDSPNPFDVQRDWQERFCLLHEDILAINFADIRLQMHWMELTVWHKYNLAVLNRQNQGT